mgnify:FL=1
MGHQSAYFAGRNRRQNTSTDTIFDPAGYQYILASQARRMALIIVVVGM